MPGTRRESGGVLASAALSLRRASRAGELPGKRKTLFHAGGDGRSRGGQKLERGPGKQSEAAKRKFPSASLIPPPHRRRRLTPTHSPPQQRQLKAGGAPFT